MKLAWEAGFRTIEVETDSQCVVRLLSNNTPKNHPLFSIIDACKLLIMRDWNCSVNHIYREGNRVADALAKIGQSLGLGLTVFDVPPPQIFPLLEADSKGVSFARMCPSS